MDFSLKNAKRLRKDLRRMTKAQDEGDTLTAYDLAKKHVDSGWTSLGLHYHMVLALARVGLTDHAIKHYNEWEMHEQLLGKHRSELAGLAARIAEHRAAVKISRSDDDEETDKPRTDWTADYFGRAYEDVAALGARLQKDKSWNSSGADRRKHAQQSSVYYAKVYEDTHGFYVGINCAAMHLLAGDPSTAAATAIQVLAKWEHGKTVKSEEEYLFAAMMLQANLLAKEYKSVKKVAANKLKKMRQSLPKNLIEASTMIKQITHLYEQLDVNTTEAAKADAAKDAATKADAAKDAAANAVIAKNDAKQAAKVAAKKASEAKARNAKATTRAAAKVAAKNAATKSAVAKSLAAKVAGARSAARKATVLVGKVKVSKGYRDLIMAELPRPTIIHFCGHMASAKDAGGRFPFEEEGRVTKEIEKKLKDNHVGAGYGSLACGADILFAEELLRRNNELHVILPFEADSFIETSVRRGGVGWIPRFRDCLRKATSTHIASLGGFMGDIALFRYGSDIAMGQAMLRAEKLNLPRKQIAVWDTADAVLIAGTSENISRWEKHNDAPIIISSGPKKKTIPYSSRVSSGQGYGREIRSFLFGDIKGFSKLTEERLPGFWDTVIPLFADIIKQFPIEIEHYNTWGDGIYLVLTDTAVAAECALRLQEGMRERKGDFVAAGLPEDLALRLGGHVGPVLQTKDAVHERLNWCGTSIAKAARVEPVTRPGEVFVTEAFASILAVEAGNSEFACEYEGNRPAAKDYGNFRMYRLRRKHSS